MQETFFLSNRPTHFSTQITKVIPLILKARFILHALALTSKPWTSKWALQILTEFMDTLCKAKARRKSQTYHFSLPPPTWKRTRIWTLWGPQETKESLNSLELLFLWKYLLQPLQRLSAVTLVPLHKGKGNAWQSCRHKERTGPKEIMLTCDWCNQSLLNPLNFSWRYFHWFKIPAISVFSDMVCSTRGCVSHGAVLQQNNLLQLL